MEKKKSLLDDITGSFYYRITRTWANGKRGEMFYHERNCPCIVFDECPKNLNGEYVSEESGRRIEDCPVVASGIVALWLEYRNYNAHLEHSKINPWENPDKISWDYAQLFKGYTDRLFKELARKPSSWDKEWCEYQIYVEKFSKEIFVNKRSVALFEYLPKDDVEEVRDVMENYIRYLKKCRSQAGYEVSKEWIVLRGVDSQESVARLLSLPFSEEADRSELEDYGASYFEDLEEYDVKTILHRLENQGFVNCCWILPNDPYDITITDAGRCRLNELEEVIRRKGHAKVTESGKGAQTPAQPAESARLAETVGDALAQYDVLNTKRARKYFQKAIDKGWMRLENGKLSWVQIGSKGELSQLAYFLGRVYGYEHTASGNAGAEFPKIELRGLFQKPRIYDSLVQAHNAIRLQKWRPIIDELFK